ncbi:MAG: FAD-dependent thymidylate synthase [Desulfovibrionaceae bacterium]|nr:FAD-dependent thymidylate synthase [Desulfovibrionaceae bacterium]
MYGKRQFSVVYPKRVAEFTSEITLPSGHKEALSGHDLAELISQWYSSGVQAGVPEEELRYLKPQATEFKAIIGMNAHALLDWFAIRCCRNAQAEIRDLARKMLHLCQESCPDLFQGAGPNCVRLGYCPENERQNKACVGHVLTKKAALEILQKHQDGQL